MKYILPVTLILIGMLLIFLGTSMIIHVYKSSNQEVVIRNYNYRQLDEPVRKYYRGNLLSRLRE